MFKDQKVYHKNNFRFLSQSSTILTVFDCNISFYFDKAAFKLV